jgi:hypothetical protein
MPTIPAADAMYPGGPENRLGNSIPVRPDKRFETKDKNIADPSDLTLDQNVKAPTLDSHIDEIIRAVSDKEKKPEELRTTLKAKFADSGAKSGTERMPFFNPDVGDIAGANPNKLPFTGTPAEVYNSYRELGFNREQSIEFGKKYMANMHEKYPEWADQFVKPGMSDKDEI